jgi:uncharacterized protein (TIGR03067 family)
MRTVLLVLAGFLIAADAKEDAKQDMDNLEGTWICTSNESNGKKRSDELNRQGRLIFKGNKLTQKFGEIELKLIYYTLYPSAGPKRIILKDEKPGVMRGIYELQGDTLKTCFGLGRDMAYPSEFTGKAGFALATFKRQADR